MEEYIVAVRQQDQRLLNIINQTIDDLNKTIEYRDGEEITEIKKLKEQAEKDADKVRLSASRQVGYSCQE